MFGLSLGAQQARVVRVSSTALGGTRNVPLFKAVNHCGHSMPSGPRKVERPMKNFAKKVQRFLVSEDGPTAVEYAVMLALIVIVCLTAIQAIGTNANIKFEQVRDALV
jgi:pilus assembly protein Flp/PilA